VTRGFGGSERKNQKGKRSLTSYKKKWKRNQSRETSSEGTMRPTKREVAISELSSSGRKEALETKEDTGRPNRN